MCFGVVLSLANAPQKHNQEELSFVSRPLAELQKAGLTGVFDEWAGKRKDEIFTERYKKGNKACILVKQLIQ